MKTRTKNLKTVFLFLLTRAFWLYIFAALFIHFLCDYQEGQSRARGAAISRYMPDFRYLVDFRDERVPFDQKKFKESDNYFRLLNKYMPDHADVLGMLGFCSYYLGQEKDAAMFYEQALYRFPGSFAYRYNLGVLAFKRGDYAQAKEYFLKSLEAPLPENLNYISSSRVFWPLYNNVEEIKKELPEYIKKGRERSYRLLTLCYYHLKDFAGLIPVAQFALNFSGKDQEFYYYSLGLAYLHLRQYPQTFLLLQKALTIDPGVPETQRLFNFVVNTPNETPPSPFFEIRAKDRPTVFHLQIY